MELLFYLFTAMPYVVAALLGLALPLMLLAAYNSFSVGLVLICATFVLEIANLSQPFLRIGLTIFVPDLPMVLLGIAAGLRWLLRDDLPRRHLSWIVLALVFFVGLALGLAQNGTTAGVQARGDYYAVAAASYAMSFPIAARELRRLVACFSAVAVAMVLLSGYRWTVYYGNFRELLPPGGTYNIDGAIRVIGSGGTLVIAQALVLGLFFASARLGARGAQLLSPLLLGAVLALQHRSVWLAAIAGLLISLIVARAQRAPLWQQLTLGSVVVLAAAAPLMFSQTLSGQLQSSASTALAGQGTVNARFENWRATLEKWAGDGPRSIAMGRTPGSDTLRTIETESGETRRIGFSAHNHYVSTLTGTGVLGFGALLWLLVSLVLALWRRCGQGDEDSPAAALLLVLTGMQLVYYVAYGADYLQYLVMGMAVAWAAGHRGAAAATGAATAPTRRGGAPDRRAASA